MVSHASLARGLRRSLATKWAQSRAWECGTVAAVHTGTTPKTVDVNIEGSAGTTLAIRYNSNYTPTVNDYVIIGKMQTNRIQKARFVICKLA